MEEDNAVLSLIEDAENVMQDIFLSGFHSVGVASVEKIEKLQEEFASYGMTTAKEYLHQLKEQLHLRRNSFSYDVNQLTKTFCILEFYFTTAKQRLK